MAKKEKEYVYLVYYTDRYGGCLCSGDDITLKGVWKTSKEAESYIEHHTENHYGDREDFSVEKEEVITNYACFCEKGKSIFEEN